MDGSQRRAKNVDNAQIIFKSGKEVNITLFHFEELKESIERAKLMHRPFWFGETYIDPDQIACVITQVKRVNNEYS